MTESPHLELRAGLAAHELARVAKLGPPPSNIDEFYHTATLPNNFTSKLKVWRSHNITSSANRPVILLFHGGAFTSGSIEMETLPGRAFAEAFNAVVVAATYRLAPEHPFPTGVEDAWSVLHYLADGGAAELGGDVKAGLIVGGHSAGGHIAAVLAQLSLTRGLPEEVKVTGVYLGVPSVLVEEIVPERFHHLWKSRQQFSNGPGFSSKDVQGGLDLLGADVKSELFSPFNAKNFFEGGHAPAYIQVCENDPLRDDGIVYETALKERGVNVRLDVTPGANHQTFCTIVDENMDISELREKTMLGVRWLLDGGRAELEY